jgi:DNA-directed RNA polymerase subunit D
MRITNVKYDGNMMSFDTTMSDILFNTIRRNLYRHVKMMAVDRITVTLNESEMYTGELEHNLLLLPLHQQQYRNQKDEDTVSFELNVTNTTKQWITVYSNSLIPLEENPPVHFLPNIAITILRPSNSLRLMLFASLGSGQQHARWNPITCALMDVTGQHCEIESVEGVDVVAAVKAALEKIADDLYRLKESIS